MLRLEGAFLRRVRELPSDTQKLLLLAAASSPGQGDLLWEAAAELAIPESAAAPAEAAHLLTFWPEVRFTHPLVRSAIYHAATAAERLRFQRIAEVQFAVSLPECTVAPCARSAEPANAAMAPRRW